MNIENIISNFLKKNKKTVKDDKNQDIEIEYRFYKNNKIMYNEYEFNYIFKNFDKDIFNLDTETKYYKSLIIGINKNIFEYDDNYNYIRSYKSIKKGNSKNINDNIEIVYKVETEVPVKNIELKKNYSNILLKKRVSYTTKDKKWRYDFTWESDLINVNFNHNKLSLSEINNKITDMLKSKVRYIKGYLEVELLNKHNAIKKVVDYNDYIIKLDKYFKGLLDQNNKFRIVRNTITNLLNFKRFHNLYNISSSFDYLSHNNINNIVQKDIYFTLKLDGTHMYLFIMNNTGYLIDSSNKINIINFTNSLSNSLNNSLFEVELIDNEIYIVSVLLYNKKDYTKLTYNDNLKILNTTVYDNLNNINGTLEILSMEDNQSNLKSNQKSNKYKLKRFKGVDKDEGTKKLNSLIDSNIPNDGLLLMIKDSNYKSGKVFKWKLSKYLSIDFLVNITKSNNKYIMNLFNVNSKFNKINRENSSNNLNNNELQNLFSFLISNNVNINFNKFEQSLVLYNTITNSYEVNVKKIEKIDKFDTINFTKNTELYTIQVGRKNFKIFDGMIVECLYNTKNNRFEIFRTRDDKTYTNFISILSASSFRGVNGVKMFEKIFNIIQEPLTKKDLLTYFK